MKRKVTRRIILRGLGGAVMTLPLLESLGPLHAAPAPAAAANTRFAIFFRQACGVACAQTTAELGMETEKFWPTTLGPLSSTITQGRALDELATYFPKLLVVKNVNNEYYNYGDGHANGALQGLTAQGPVVQNAAGDSEANGESIDHRIGRELNPGARDSLFLYAGPAGGWLGGACISYRGAGQRRAATRNPWDAYQAMMGGAGMSAGEATKIATRQKSVNDLLRAQIKTLMSTPKIGNSDKQRLQLHFDAVRELELSLSCNLDQSNEQMLQGGSAVYDLNDKGDDTLAITKLHMDVAALAVACGYTHSVSIQVGNGNDGSTRYPDPDTGTLMSDNYHYISHRRQSHDSSGTIIPGSDLLHHQIDRQFARAFKHLLDNLAGYPMADGKKLIDHGVAVWYNDNANGPAHGAQNVPFVLAGSAQGYFKQGQYVAVGGNTDRNQNRMLSTIGAAVGVKNAAGGELDDFGDPAATKGQISEIKA